MSRRISASLSLVLLLFVISPFLNAQQDGSIPKGFKKFRGAWFDIVYPKDFQVRVSLISKSDGDRRAESVFFRSPDGAVEFYIFSPQWSGEPKDIAMDPGKEVMGDRSSTTKDGTTTTMYTIKAKNGSYMRSYRDITTESTRHVIGIKYRDKTSYSKYRGKYVKFRDSLVQYADGWDGEE